MHNGKGKLIVALDVSDLNAVRSVTSALGEEVSFYKVGLELFTAVGPAAVSELVSAGRQVFLDLKLHDIPNTAAAAARSAAKLGVTMLTVHAAGGAEMLRAAAESAKATNPAVIVLAVTVLTSLDARDLSRIGVQGAVQDQVSRLASLAIENGCQGLVCSPLELEVLRAQLGQGPVIVTPGIRPAGSATGDQARTATPAQAIQAGANFIVVGRPITAAADPSAAARAISREIQGVI